MCHGVQEIKTMLFHEFRQVDVDGITVKISLNVYESPVGEYTTVKTELVGIGTHKMELPVRVDSIAKFMENLDEYKSMCLFGEERIETIK